MTQIEKKTYPIQVNGKEVVLSFKFELLPNDIKYLAFLAGELSISASYFSPLADVKRMPSTVFKGLLVNFLKTNGILGNTVKGLEWLLQWKKRK